MIANTFIFIRYLKSYAVLKPFIDVESRLCKLDDLKSSIKRRRLNVNIDEISVFNEKLKELETIKDQLEKSREEVKHRISQIDQSSDDSVEKVKLKMKAKILRDDYKQFKSSVSDLRQNLIRLTMSVPNDLHPKTGDEDEVLHESAVTCENAGNHLDIGSRFDLLEYKSRWEYFLKGEAAAFELKSICDLSKRLKGEGFIGFSNPDFSREIVIDGCEGIYSSYLPLEDSEDAGKTFMNGGASPLPFFSYFSKSVLKEDDLPVKCYATGRQYSNQISKFALYNAPQTNACQVFLLTSDISQDEHLFRLISTVRQFYDTFGIHYRVIIKGAQSLCLAESLRISFEVFSPNFNRFFECGDISMYGTHLSKTMNIRCDGSSANIFPSVVCGTVFRVTPLLACILETKTSSDWFQTCS